MVRLSARFLAAFARPTQPVAPDLQKAVGATMRVPTDLAGKPDYSKIPVGHRAWVAISHPDSPLHGRHVLVERGEHGFTLAGDDLPGHDAAVGDDDAVNERRQVLARLKEQKEAEETAARQKLLDGNEHGLFGLLMTPRADKRDITSPWDDDDELVTKSDDHWRDEPRTPAGPHGGEWATAPEGAPGKAKAGHRGVDKAARYWVYLNLHKTPVVPIANRHTGEPIIDANTGQALVMPAPDRKVWSLRNMATHLVDAYGGWQRPGSAAAHAGETIVLKDADLHVRQNDRRLVVATGIKNVHAGVRGALVDSADAPTEGWQPVHYNPKERPEMARAFFWDARPGHWDERVTHAAWVRFTPTGTEIIGPSYRPRPGDDDRYAETEEDRAKAADYLASAAARKSRRTLAKSDQPWYV